MTGEIIGGGKFEGVPVGAIDTPDLRFLQIRGQLRPWERGAVITELAARRRNHARKHAPAPRQVDVDQLADLFGRL